MDINTKITLNNDVKIPILGLGTYQTKSGEEAYNAVRFALDTGYRHIDTAALYANEEDVGKAVKDSGIPREQIFVTTKLWNSEHGYDKALNAFHKSLKKLNTDFVDLYLIHWPVTGLRLKTWDALMHLYSKGLVRSIGVSNYTIKHLKELIKHSDILPAVNQVEFSLYLYQKELLDFCNSHKVHVEAYTPLIRGKKFSDPKLIALADNYGKTPAQILIRWALQVGTIALPKSSRKEKILENASIFDFEISENDMTYMISFNENYRVAWNPSEVE